MNHEGIKLLIVDDEEAHIESIRRAFRESGVKAEIRAAGTLREYRESIAADQPDIALIDLNLPDGRATEALCGTPLAAPFPVVVITAYGDQETVVQVMKGGAMDYVSKSPEAFIEMPHFVEGVLREWELLLRQKQVQADLQESHNLITSVIENIPLMIFLKEPKYLRFVIFNRAGEELLGYDRKDLLGKSNLDLFPPEQAANFMSKDREVLDGAEGALDIPEESLLTAKKGTRLLHTRKVCIRGADGAAKYLLSISEDITERKQADTYREITWDILQTLNKPLNLEDSVKSIVTILKTRGGFDAVGIRLKKGEDFPYFFELGFPEDFLLTENTLAERGADGGLCRDKDGKVRLECTCGLVISGKPAPVLTKAGSFWTNDSFPLLDLPASQDPRLNPRNNCIHKNYASVALVPIRGKAGIAGLLQLNSRQKGRFNDGIIAQLETTAASIGEALLRKRAEEERADMQLMLYQSQKMESVGRLAGGVAHDFNNLLTVITGNAQFLKQRLVNDKAGLEDLKDIMTAAGRAAELTRQLLAFSSKQMFSPQLIDLNKALPGIVKMLKRLISDDIKLATRFTEQTCLVRADAGQIDQVIVNLAVNARDAMPDNGTLQVETSLITPGKDLYLKHPHLPRAPLVCLSLKDTGCGMTEEIREHIFEPFFTTKDKSKGTGLGLATVYGIVKQNGWAIDVESAPDRGSTFRIYLPQAACSLADRATAKDEKAAKGGAANEGETVLLVDDEAALLRMGERQLLMYGYTVITADDGEKALKAAEHLGRPVDLLLTDVILPGMNGRQLAAELAGRKLARKTLYMSGYTDEVFAKHGLLEPGIALILKPFTEEALIAKIREVLDAPDAGPAL